MRPWCQSLLILAALCFAVTGSAGAGAAAEEQPREGVSITIYNAPREQTQSMWRGSGYGTVSKPSGWAVVKQRRRITLAEGESDAWITDVAAAIVPASVRFTSLTDPANTLVLHQNFLYDLATPQTLLQRFTGTSVTVVEEKGDLLQGTLLNSRSGAGLLLNLPAMKDPVRLTNFRELRLPALPDGLVTRPTLFWRVRARKGGEHLAEVTYLTDDCTWRADYILRVNPADKAKETETLALAGWATIENESGTAYPDARLKLMGGDVQRLEEPDVLDVEKARGSFGKRKGNGSETLRRFVEKSFFEYHLYTLGRPTTLPDRSKKQIELFPPADDVPFHRIYVYEGGRLPANARQAGYMQTQRQFGFSTNTKVDVYMEFKNEEKGHLGMALPAGRVRIYLRDGADEVGEFIGEDEIEHTPKDETVRLRLGSAFDVTGERRQTDFQSNNGGHWITESFEIRLRNHKQEAVKVYVHEALYRWVNWKIETETHAHEKLDARKARFKVDVPADGESVLKYTVRYDW